ncbi:MAG: sugar nucleotide-binding protein [Bowdeniella nasicola]|nr:sugar nucleotide-binding protein [Bowdeniella nasicola]
MSRGLRVQSTQIPGLLVVDLPVHGDNRGWFKENWQRETMVAAGVPDFAPVQQNMSFNEALGTTRGIHAEPWDKFVSVATGRVFGAWVDLREGETFGVVVTREITPGRAVFVPRGVGNAFQTLEPNTVYSYLVNDHWSADAQENYAFVNLADPQLGIDWPIDLAGAEMSDNDRAHPALADCAPVRPAPLLILGARGQLGRALVAACREREIPFEAWDRGGFDLARPESWEGRSLRGYRAVLNAAADTAVDAAEMGEGRRHTWAVNATGVSALARRCGRDGVPLLHVSTDYVFDGERPVGEEYEVDASVAPLSVYGQSKAAGECAVGVLDQHWIVRTSWVIGDGQNFVTTMLSLAERGVDPAVVDDQHGRPTFAVDLAAGILDLVTKGAPWGTYHVTNSGPRTTWYDFARAIFEAGGHNPNRVRAVSTGEYIGSRTGVAPRPHNAALRGQNVDPYLRVPVDWRDALERYVNAAR